MLRQGKILEYFGDTQSRNRLREECLVEQVPQMGRDEKSTHKNVPNKNNSRYS